MYSKVITHLPSLGRYKNCRLKVRKGRDKLGAEKRLKSSFPLLLMLDKLVDRNARLGHDGCQHWASVGIFVSIDIKEFP